MATAAPEEEDFIDLRHLWGILLRRKGTVLLAAALVVLIGLIYTFTATPIYRGTLLLQIDRQEGQVVKYQDVTPDEGGAGMPRISTKPNTNS